MLHQRTFTSQRGHRIAVHQEHLHVKWRPARASFIGSARPETSSPAERLQQARAPAPKAVGGDASAEGVARSGGGAAADVASAVPAAVAELMQQLRRRGAAASQPPQIAVLSFREQPEVARAAVENIAAAFEDDPSTTYFCRPSQRVQFYRSVLTCLLDWYPEERQLVSTLPPDAAAFVYVYPRLRELGSWTKLLRGGLAPLGCVRLGRLVAGMDASDFFEGQREEFLQAHGPFMYVSVMAVAPGRQGRGLGSALLAFICDRADAAGLHCYIEATSPRNRALYERFGFQLIQAWRANPEMPYTYVLSRPPRPMDCETTGPADADAATVAATAAAATAAMPPLWWQPSGQQRRQRFAEVRKQQLRRRRRQAEDMMTGGPVYDDVQTAVQYTDLDAYSWWPLPASQSDGASAAAGEEGVEMAGSASVSAAAAAGDDKAAGWFGGCIGGRSSKNDANDSSTVYGSDGDDTGGDPGGGAHG
ncbi:hypothetical protein PLESTF_001894400 [Pleodorina starrii]|nr:hypothetical protein PLESTM_000693000 [Pleodorina starrii]GLC77175.1 hypothetical protein PLESTF_001894400 [Pleodorina starrii]